MDNYLKLINYVDSNLNQNRKCNFSNILRLISSDLSDDNITSNEAVMYTQLISVERLEFDSNDTIELRIADSNFSKIEVGGITYYAYDIKMSEDSDNRIFNISFNYVKLD